MKTRYFTFFIVAFISSQCYAQLDNTFGTNGKVIIPIGNEQDYITGMVLDNDGIILGGYYSNSFDADYSVVKLDNNGTLDNTFGINGILKFDFGSTLDICNSMALQIDGKILMAGYIYNGSNSDFGISRVLSDGSLDVSFDADGRDSVAFTSSSIDRAYAIKEIVNNKILVLGETSDGVNSDFALAKLNSDGSYDLSFNTNGKFTFSVDDGDFGNCLGVQTDGKIIIGGSSTSDFVAIRVNTDGTIDNTFGVNGVRVVDLGSNEEVNSMIIQSDDKIILVGKTGNETGVLRLNADGSVDITFNTNGIVKISEGITTICNSLTLDQNNKLVLVGYTYNGSRGDVFIVRLNADGSESGRGSINIGIGNSAGKSVLIDVNNKIVIGCNAIYDGSDDDFAVIRLNDVFVTSRIEMVENISVNIFPNPANHYLNVHSSNTIENISIVDVLGNEVMEVKKSGNIQLDISSLKKGLYNLVIETDRGVGYKKLSVQ